MRDCRGGARVRGGRYGASSWTLLILTTKTRTQSGCIPPGLVSRLLERGHAEAVERWAGRGEWFCAREWARLLAERGRQAEALEVLAPYVATGWWTAAAAMAELLEANGRADEAISLVRPHAEGGDRLALGFFARLLARHGRGDEAFDLLRPHIEDWYLAEPLVDIAGPTGRHEEAFRLLADRTENAPPPRCCDHPPCGGRRVEPFNAVNLVATIRERQGRVDDAIALLRTRESTSINNRDPLADLLARHDRTEELRAYAATEHHGHAALRLADLLEEQRDVEGAIAAYRQAAGPAAQNPNSAFGLARLLARHGRGNAAIEVVRIQADARPGEDWILHTLADLCLDQGRPADGLAHLDDLAAARGGEEEWDLFWMRLPLIAAGAGVDEAVERARAHPEGNTSYAAEHIAALLAGAGRTEEAVAVLEQHACANRHDLAGYLIDLGRIDDAVNLLQQTSPRPPATSTAGLWQDEPPF
ncbi:tetratricopeptide repeat protein [Kitasatospora indigofera]|uniref:tetratricopeptide repeat protein n=1 Tax=Kitasatospora indigofera TaxID=67307 RepID=UPI0033ACD58C